VHTAEETPTQRDLRKFFHCFHGRVRGVCPHTPQPVAYLQRLFSTNGFPGAQPDWHLAEAVLDRHGQQLFAGNPQRAQQAKWLFSNLHWLQYHQQQATTSLLQAVATRLLVLTESPTEVLICDPQGVVQHWEYPSYFKCYDQPVAKAYFGKHPGSCSVLHPLHGVPQNYLAWTYPWRAQLPPQLLGCAPPTARAHSQLFLNTPPATVPYPVAYSEDVVSAGSDYYYSGATQQGSPSPPPQASDSGDNHPSTTPTTSGSRDTSPATSSEHSSSSGDNNPAGSHHSNPNLETQGNGLQPALQAALLTLLGAAGLVPQAPPPAPTNPDTAGPSSSRPPAAPPASDTAAEQEQEQDPAPKRPRIGSGPLTAQNQPPEPQQQPQQLQQPQHRPYRPPPRQQQRYGGQGQAPQDVWHSWLPPAVLYNNCLDKYAPENLTPEEQRLHQHMSVVVAAFGGAVAGAIQYCDNKRQGPRPN
jgi:hypothetical protein